MLVIFSKAQNVVREFFLSDFRTKENYFRKQSIYVKNMDLKKCHLQLSAPQQPPTYDCILKYLLINGLSKGQVIH